MLQRLFRLSIAVLTITAGTAVADTPDVTVTPVRGSVYMLEGYGGNIGISAGADGIVMVDDQMESVLAPIQEALASLSDGAVRFLLNTHFHGDHTGNNPVFGRDATIIAHENVRARLKSGEGGGEGETMDAVGWPVITFDKSVKIHFNDEEIRVLHLADGHTDGDAIVYFTESNVLHIGDQLFSGLFPYIDLDHGGTVDGYIANLEWVLDTFPRDVKVIPGHGPLSTLDDLRIQRDMILATREIVRKKVAAGESLEAIQEAGLPGVYDRFDWEFITTARWIEILWNAEDKS